MIKHSETKWLEYSSEQMFLLVADIESYPSFIPWCTAVKIKSRNDGKLRYSEIIDADMRVSFKIFREVFSCFQHSPVLFCLNPVQSCIEAA